MRVFQQVIYRVVVRNVSPFRVCARARSTLLSLVLSLSCVPELHAVGHKAKRRVLLSLSCVPELHAVGHKAKRRVRVFCSLPIPPMLGPSAPQQRYA